MKKERRLLKNNDFKEIIEMRKSLSTSSYVVYYRNNDLEHGRVGISVSKKNGNAVVRNRLKRQVRSMIDQLFNFNLSLDLVVIIRNNYLQQDYATNKMDLQKILEKIFKGVKKWIKERKEYILF